MRLITKVLIGVILAVLVLWLLNPSYSRFKQFASEIPNNVMRKVVYKKNFDGLIYSIYEKQIVTWDGQDWTVNKSEKYIGFLLNFYRRK